MYVLDTDVVSKLRLDSDPSVAVWMQEQADQLFITATTVAEIEAGIAKLRREGATRKSTDLSDWLNALLHLYGDRVLSFDLPAARIAGLMTDRARAAGHTPGFADTTIAAIAAYRGFVVLTRNLKHFLPSGAPAIDPFVTLPHGKGDINQVRRDAIVAAANANVAVLDDTMTPIRAILDSNDIVWCVWQDVSANDNVGMMIVKGVRRLEGIAGALNAPAGVAAMFEKGASLTWSAIVCESAEQAEALRNTFGDGAP